MASFELEIDKNCKVLVKSYNEMAAWCYQKLIKNNIIIVEGKINSKMEIIINKMYKIMWKLLVLLVIQFVKNKINSKDIN